MSPKESPSEPVEIFGPAPGPEASVVGSLALGVGPENLPAAVDALVAVGPQVRHLKIGAGEHIAGLILTAFNGPPASIDTDGGLDFVFERRRSTRWSWNFGEADTAAVEVKSAPGRPLMGYRPYRQYERHASLGDSHATEVRPAFELLVDASAAIQSAIAALDRKVAVGWSRHVFLILHLFDGVPLEGFEEPMMFAHRLPPLKRHVRLDMLWVLFHGVGLVRWSQVDQRWANLLLGIHEGDQPLSMVDDRGHDLQAAESAFLEAIGHTGGSPWLYDLRVGDDS